MRLYPNLKKSKYEEFKEVWNLPRGELPETIERIEVSAEEDFVEESPLLAKEARKWGSRRRVRLRMKM